MTWEYRSITINSSTWTLPYSHTRPRSLRPRSTSMTCSARSFSSASSSAASAGLLRRSLPRGRVPAIGPQLSRRRLRTRTITSGLEPTTAKS